MGCAIGMFPYTPISLPPDTLDFRKLNKATGDATAELCRYDGLLQGIINPSLFLSPLTTQEAVLSSKIEGTQATIDEVLQQDAGIKREGVKEIDILEVKNYREALCKAQEQLLSYPITLSFICELHKILLQGVRGQNKNPGQFRKDQNWIGRPGSSIEEATYVPPDPLQIRNHLENWLSFMYEEELDPLVQAAMVHAQFEMIHPFDDGNGRIGRIIIPLYLYSKKRLSQPMFYLSAYLESHREEYYSCLQGISQRGDWNSWVLFFLRAVKEQACLNCIKVQNIMELYDRMKTEVQELTHSQYTVQLLDEVFAHPVFNSRDFNVHTAIPRGTANKLLAKMKDAGILEELHPARGSTPAVYLFSELLNLTEGR